MAGSLLVDYCCYYFESLAKGAAKREKEKERRRGQRGSGQFISKSAPGRWFLARWRVEREAHLLMLPVACFRCLVAQRLLQPRAQREDRRGTSLSISCRAPVLHGPASMEN